MGAWCDRCGSKAYVYVTLDTGGKLSFCAHDYRTVEEALLPYAVRIIDDRALLTA